MNVFGSESGWRPFLPVFGADRSRSRWANRAPGMCASPYCCSPSAGLARSWRQSKTRHSGWAASSSVETSVVFKLFRRNAEFPAQPFVEMHHRVLHRRLVGAGVVQALLPERPAAAVQAAADLVVFQRGFDVGGPLRLDELALEMHDFLRVVELHHIGRK